VLGTRLGLDLPGFGVSARRRDLLLEVDWTNDNAGCLFHSHRPTPETFVEVQEVFAAIPLANPDGTTGIHLIIDYGQSPLFSGGNLIAGGGTIGLPELRAIYQPVHFSANRRGYFRYSIHAHTQGLIEAYSGVGDGDESLVTLGCQLDTPGYVRNVTVHELGHDLGLQHGGDDICNRKPNYNSSMNYNHLFGGLDIDCDRYPDGIQYVGFSDGSRRELTEAALVEQDGVCPAGHPFAKPVDWNLNGFIDGVPVAVDLACNGLKVLTDWNDIEHLRLKPYNDPSAAHAPPLPPAEPCAAPPEPGDPP
jgi:hypothetical protein